MLSQDEFWSGLRAAGVVVTDDYTDSGEYRWCEDWDGACFPVPVYDAYPDYLLEKVLHEHGFTNSDPLN